MNLYFNSSNLTSGFLQICVEDIACPTVPRICPEGETPTTDFDIIAGIAAALFTVSFLALVWLFRQRNYENVFYWSKFLFCGSPIIHPMLLNDNVVLSNLSPFKGIFETALESNVKLFFVTDRETGKSCFEKLKTNLSFDSRILLRKLEGKEKELSKLWNVQPLHFLLQKDLLGIFSFLTFLGASWKVQNERRETALDEFLRILEKDIEIDVESVVKNVVKRRFNSVNALAKMWLMSDKKWLKLFERALELKLENCLDILIENKSQIGERNCDKFGNTALHLACKANLCGTVEKLSRKMTNLNIKNFKGLTALHLAVRKNNSEIVKLLISKEADLNCKDIEGRTALHHAAICSSGDCLKILIESKADLSLSDEKNQTALHLAAANKEINFELQLLIENNADVDSKDFKEQTPLHLAAVAGNADLLKQLLDTNRCEVDATDVEGATAAHLVSECGHYECLKLLIDRGADINSKDREMRTPLHQAAMGNSFDCLRLLIDHNALTEEINCSGETPLQVAVQYCTTDCTELLIEAKADVNTSDDKKRTLLHSAVSRSRLDQAEFLIAAGADINATDDQSKTPLHLAAENFSNSCVECLVKKGANIEGKDESGKTPLHVAAEVGNSAGLDLLIEARADVNAKDNSGNTPLHLNLKPEKAEPKVDGKVLKMPRAKSVFFDRCCESLVMAGADVEAMNNRRERPKYFQRVIRLKKINR